MSYEVTAAFEETIAFPEDQASDDFDYIFLVRGDEGITDPSIHFFTCLAKEALTRFVEKQVPEASSVLRPLETRISEKDLGINYDQFLDIIQSQGGKLVKNIGLGQQDEDTLIIKWPVYEAANLRSLSTTLMGSTYSGQINIKLDPEQMDYETIYGAHGALSLALSRATNFENSKIFNIDLTVDENLIDTILNGDGATFNFTDKLDQDAISAIKRVFNGVQLQVVTPSAGSGWPYVPKSPEKGEEPVPETEFMAKTREIERKKATLNDMLYYSNVNMFIDLRVSSAIFKFFTQSDTIDLQDCHRWFSSYYTNGFVNDKYVPGIMRSLSSVIKDTEKVKKVNLSENSYSVNFDGQIVYVPNVEDTSIYDQLKEAQNIFIREEKGVRWYDPNHVMCLSETMGDLDVQTTLKQTLQGQYNRIIYTDWALNKLVYTNTMGNINIIDMNGWKGANLSTFCTLFKSKLTTNEEHNPVASALTDLNKLLPKISPDKPNFLSYAELEDLVHLVPLDRRDHFMTLTLDQAFAYIYELRVSWGFPDTINGDCNFFEYFREVRVALSRINENPIKDQQYGNSFDYEIFAEEPTLRSLTDWPMLRCVHRAAKMVLTYIEQDPMSFIQQTGVVRSMGIIPIIKVMSEDSPSDLIAQDKSTRDNYIKPKLDKDYTPLPVPNIGNHVSLLPHQVKVDNHVKNENPYTVLNVAAGGGKCLLGNTLVPTTEGILTLEELWNIAPPTVDYGFRALNVGVLTHENEMSPTNAVYKRTGDTFFTELSDGTYIEGLPDHKLWAYNTCNHRQFKFTRLDYLKEGDWIPKSLGSNIYNTQPIRLIHDLSYYGKQTLDHFESIGAKLPTEMTPKLAALCGYFVSEGYLSVDWDVVTFTNHDPEILEHFSSLYKDLFGYELKLGKEGDKSVGYGVNNKIIRDFLCGIIGRHKSKDKVVPTAIRQGSKRIQRAFLRTLFEGDGTIYNEYSDRENYSGNWQLEYCSLSETLIYQVKIMLENMGILAPMGSVEKTATNGKEGNKSTAWIISIPNKLAWLERYQKLVNFKSERKKKKLQEAIDHKDWLMSESIQSTNETVFGQCQQVPCGVLAEKVFEAIIDICSKYVAYTDNRGVNQNWTRHSLGGHYGFSLKDTKTLNKEDGSCSVFWIDRLKYMLNNLPKGLGKNANEHPYLRKWWSEIEELSNYYWVKVLNTGDTGYKMDVYDLSVPDYHSYAFSGIYGHNTISGLITALRAMQKKQKVLVLCPNYLMKNYVADGLYMAQGKLNTICIDNQVYTEYGEERLGRLINSAPPNTLFLSGFSVFSMGKNINYEYFGEDIVINQICEFIRSVKWDMVIIDESHQLANSHSNRSRQIARLLAGVPKVMQMTGTYINNMVTDALGQSRLFDPSMLGSEDEFVRQYALSTSNGKFAQPKPGAQSHIFQRLKSRSDFVTIRRKEWVALLPQRKEQFHIVNMTYNQQRAYESILKEVIKEIEDDAPDAVKQKLKQGSESDSEALEQYLKRYLARVERFLTACNLDPLGEKMLTDPEDLVSPKCQMVNEILETHFSDKNAKKVLIFTSYRDSARAVYEALDPKFQQYALHYEAEKKDELIPRIKSDPNVKIIVGVEHSLNTGHNLQACNRLIRVESIWNPGTLDQAESRINRPDPKNKETRDFIYFDWIMAASSIDMTKASRLISKLISATKFDEVGNPLYESIPDLPVVSMSFENIIHSNSFDDSLSDYIEAYRQYQIAQIQDFEQYKKLTGHLEPIPLPQGELIEGSALVNSPYVPNMELPYQDEMGLVNIGDWAMEQSLPVSKLDNSLLKGKRVHCQYGDGTIISTSKGRIRVSLDNGKKESIDKLSAFLIPDEFSKKYKGKSVKDIIGNMVSLPYTGQSEELLEEIEEQHEEQQEQIEVEKEQQEHPTPFKGTNKLDGEIDVFLASANDMLCVIVDLEEPDFTPNIARELGMKNSGPYWFAHCKTYKHLDNLLDKVIDVLDVPQKQVDILDSLLEAFTEGRSKLFNVDQTTRFDIKNFYDLKKRKVPKGTIYLYPIIEDGNFYVAAWEDRQPSVKQLIKVRIPGLRWEYDPGNYRRFFTTKKEAQVFIKSLAKRFKIINFEEVKEEFKNIKLIKRKPKK